MEYISFNYNPTNAVILNSKDYQQFKNNAKYKNIIYFFFRGTECLYIGETKNSIFDRCFINTPKHIDKSWFYDSDNIKIIVLDSKTDIFHRQLLENSFILAYKQAGHPLRNKKG